MGYRLRGKIHNIRVFFFYFLILYYNLLLRAVFNLKLHENDIYLAIKSVVLITKMLVWRLER